MPAPNAVQQVQEVPLKIVGGSNFGRYPKISLEQTWNFIVSDDFLVPYAGYKTALVANSDSVGRGIYSSFNGEIMIAVIGKEIIRISYNSVTNELQNNGIVGLLATTQGQVYIAENNNSQICITDNAYVYVYNWRTGDFHSNAPGVNAQILTFDYPNPGYVSFQNGRLIIACQSTQYWILSGPNDALTWPTLNPSTNPNLVGTIQTKPTTTVAAIPVPGGGNNIIVLGTNVGESWQDVGASLFPYQRGVTFNIDFGCLNASSIAKLDNMIVWLGFNEQSGPVIMYTTGSVAKRISTDGIDYVLTNLTNPENCTGFLFRQDGHIIYQFTFPDDNISYIYDFNTGLFFNVSDDKLNYHIARQVVFFNNDYYFVSLRGGDVYRFGTQYTDAIYSIEGELINRELPRIRITPPLRLPSQRYFIGKSLGFTIENGQINIKQKLPVTSNTIGQILATESYVDITTESGNPLGVEKTIPETTYVVNYSEAVDLSISRDGGESFGSSWRLNMNPTGQRKSRFIWQRLGIVNDVTFQLRFSGFGRFVATDGLVEIYQ
jgi:hypothetical protein